MFMEFRLKGQKKETNSYHYCWLLEVVFCWLVGQILGPLWGKKWVVLEASVQLWKTHPLVSCVLWGALMDHSVGASWSGLVQLVWLQKGCDTRFSWCDCRCPLDLWSQREACQPAMWTYVQKIQSLMILPVISIILKKFIYFIFNKIFLSWTTTDPDESIQRYFFLSFLLLILILFFF